MADLKRAQKLLAPPELAALRKYHCLNETETYNVYTRPGRPAADFLAPEYVLIRDHATYAVRRLQIEEIEERAETIIARCLLEGEAVDLLAENLSVLLARGESRVAFSAEGGLLQGYARPAGLFNYYEENGEFFLHYHPDFGRGEHVEFFNFWQLNLFGVFTPDSFIEIKPIDRDSSRLIYRELREAGVLSPRGHLRDASLLEAHEFRTPVAREQAGALRRFLSERPRRREAERNFARLLASPPAVVQSEFSALELTPEAGLEEFLSGLSVPERRVLGQLYTERIAAARVAEQIARNRGIALMNEAGEVLLLLSDEVATSSPHYRPLYEFGLGLSETGRCRIAYAYRTPFPRNLARSHHPLVEALRDFEKLRAVDGLEDVL